MMMMMKVEIPGILWCNEFLLENALLAGLRFQQCFTASATEYKLNLQSCFLWLR